MINLASYSELYNNISKKIQKILAIKIECIYNKKVKEEGRRNLINKGIVGWSGISSGDGGGGGASER